MKYCIAQYDNIISEHASPEALNRAMQKSKKQNIYEVIVPDLELGLEIFIGDNYYGSVVQITDELIYIKRIKDEGDYINCGVILKENFLQKYISKIFAYKEVQ